MVPSGSLKSHELTLARKQNLYWNDPLTNLFSVLYIGVFDSIFSGVKYNIVDQSLSTCIETARILLSDTNSGK